MNQPGWAAAAQSKIRMFGYRAQAWWSAAFHRRMLDSAHGPPESSVFTQALGPAGQVGGRDQATEVESPMCATPRQDVACDVRTFTVVWARPRA
jgi:hypothetical protein